MISAADLQEYTAELKNVKTELKVYLEDLLDSIADLNQKVNLGQAPFGFEALLDAYKLTKFRSLLSVDALLDFFASSNLISWPAVKFILALYWTLLVQAVYYFILYCLLWGNYAVSFIANFSFWK